MHPIHLCLAGVLTLAACGPAAERSPSAVAPPRAVEEPAPEPAPARPFFVGRWAARPALCADGAWVIDEHELSTAGEVHCRFERTTPIQSGFEVEAVCTAEGPPEPHRLRFAYAQSARALLVEGGPFADAGLVRCGPDADGGG